MLVVVSEIILDVRFIIYMNKGAEQTISFSMTLTHAA